MMNVVSTRKVYWYQVFATLNLTIVFIQNFTGLNGIFENKNRNPIPIYPNGGGK
jgi:hypothetical protein